MNKNPIPQGKYRPAVRYGHLVYTAGMTPQHRAVLLVQRHGGDASQGIHMVEPRPAGAGKIAADQKAVPEALDALRDEVLTEARHRERLFRFVIKGAEIQEERSAEHQHRRCQSQQHTG